MPKILRYGEFISRLRYFGVIELSVLIRDRAPIYLIDTSTEMV